MYWSNRLTDMLPTPTRLAFPACSIKVALGIGNWAIGSYSLVITQANYCFVWYAQMPNTQLAIPSAQSNLYWISYISRVVGIWNQSLKLGCEIWYPSGWLVIILVGQGWWEILLNFHSLRRRFSNNYCGNAMEVDNIFNYSTGHGHYSTHTCVNCVQHGRFPGKKLTCKFLHELFNTNFRVFLRWLILLVKIHATCEYFFTTANMADVKLETDFVEKRLFAVKKKTTYYTLSLTRNVMFCKSTIHVMY